MYSYIYIYIYNCFLSISAIFKYDRILLTQKATFLRKKRPLREDAHTAKGFLKIVNVLKDLNDLKDFKTILNDFYGFKIIFT